ncbi:MAG: iron-siderophore ABC transporter substrate-binding protein [Egibacteraceae bacterium]
MTTTLLLDPVDELTRRELLVGGLSLAALLAARGAQPAAGAEPEGGAFPVTIEHKFGSTEVPQEPKRVVALGWIDSDALVALGVVPVATSKKLGERPGAIFPWYQDELGDAPLPEVLDVYTDGIPFERIAALRPDLVLALYSATERADYDKLARIAPTVAQPKDHVDYGAPWQLMTRVVGRAVGKPERAERLVAGVEAQFAKTRAAHPEFAGASAVVAYDNGDGTYSYWPPPDHVGQFLADLGFEAPAELAELAGGSNLGQLSGERVDLLADLDALVWNFYTPEDRPALEENPIYPRLDVAREGRAILVGPEDVISEAIGHNSALSLPLVLEALVPRLAAAVDGDPTTEVTP